MKLIIPMAGVGKRMRPHTLSTPKPLLKIAGKSLVQRITEDIGKSSNSTFEEIHFVIGDFGKTAEEDLKRIASNLGAEGFIHRQKEPLGTAHAIFCAESALKDEVIIAFADTLFEGDFSIKESDEVLIWTMHVDNPENYGVVVTNDRKEIVEFVEKPPVFIADEAIIGIYYFRRAELLKEKIEFLIQNRVLVNGEYQLTDALELLIKDKIPIKSANIEKWLDCGNKNEFLKSAKSILGRENTMAYSYPNTKIIDPVYIGNNVTIEDSVIGPNTIIEDDSFIQDSQIDNSIIFSDCSIESAVIKESIIGNFCRVKNADGVFNIGDFSSYEN